MPAYTFTVKPSPTEPGELSLFGNVRRDGSHEALTGPLGNGIQTTDNTPTTPQKSPLAVTTTAIANLVTPPNATTLLIYATSATSTATLNVSELSAMGSYMTFGLNTLISLDCGLQANFYLEAVGAAVTVSFCYVIV